MSFDIRPLIKGQDEPARQELFVDAFPEVVGTAVEKIEHYNWKFREFPASKSSYEYLYVGPRGFLGYYAALPYRYQMDGKISATAGMVCDVMTSSQARGQGVFTKIGHYATEDLKKEGLDFTTGYPIRPEVIPGHLKVGWRVAFALPMYLRVFKSRSVLGRFKLGFLAPIVDMALWFHRVLINFRRAPSSYSAEVMDSATFFQREESYSKFLKKWQEQVPNHLIKDFSFLHWRLGAPEVNYRFCVVQKNQEWIGVAILRNTDLQGVPTTAILDLMLLDSEKKNGRRLINRCLTEEAIRFQTEVCAVMMSCYSSQKMGLCRSMGFLRSPATFKLIIKKLNAQLSDEVLYSEKNWQLTWIDCDDL